MPSPARSLPSLAHPVLFRSSSLRNRPAVRMRHPRWLGRILPIAGQLNALLRPKRRRGVEGCQNDSGDRSGDGITFFSQAGIPGGVGAQDIRRSFDPSNGAWTTQGCCHLKNWANGGVPRLTPSLATRNRSDRLGGRGRCLRARPQDGQSRRSSYNAGVNPIASPWPGASADGDRTFWKPAFS